MDKPTTATPEVSVVIPYFNRQDTLLRALESVVKQSYQNLEIITVDDGSSDGSFELAERFRTDHPELSITNLRQPNGGPSSARNTGVRAARGSYVAFLDSDDSWLPEKLALQMERVKAEPDLTMIGTNYMVLPEHGQSRIAFPRQNHFIRGSYRRMLFKIFLCMPTVLVDRQVFTRHGIWFREGQNHGEDALFFLMVARRFNTGRLHEPVTCIHKQMYGQDGLSANMGELLRNDLNNVAIIAREPDHLGRRMNPALAYFLMGFMYVKHFKRVLVTRRQKFCAR